ncbi:unnamed protein product [Lactuca virosa]|uniref:Uncharacterized protein n=1 Tax=Lactuca virosa TaxID=75947 RepID=A0AAU9MHB6_9ASTR|nr:unnamed protein product [Lactuca virosa]
MFFEDDQDVTVSCGRICISTKNKNIISEMVTVMIEGVEYHVRVREIASWKVDILEEEEEEVDSVHDNMGCSDNEGMGDVHDIVSEDDETVEETLEVGSPKNDNC